MEAPELRADINSTSTESGHLGAFEASGHPGNHSDTTSSSMMNSASRTGFYDNDTGFRNNSTMGSQSRNGQTMMGTHRTPSSIITEQSSHGGLTNMDRKLMNSIESDLHAMHSTDPEEFEGVASKIDETFGINALI